MSGKVKTVHFPILANYIVRIEIAKDLDAAAKKSKLTDCDASGCDGLCYHSTEMGGTYIFLKPDVTNGTIAHEAYHAIRQMMVLTGVELDSEVVAYHLGYLVDKISRMWRKK